MNKRKLAVNILSLLLESILQKSLKRIQFHEFVNFSEQYHWNTNSSKIIEIVSSSHLPRKQVLYQQNAIIYTNLKIGRKALNL